MADGTSARAVLVVDDDRDLRELVADVLEGSGRRVFTASDGADALRLIEEDGIPRPCIVLLDWFMAPMGGRAFLEHLSLRHDATGFRVILLSASHAATPGDLPLTVLGVLLKPFGIDELLGTLDGQG
ncbi:MAG TPA: response regulator [Myxococcaceae bacterium]|nr:response regulator [Myxococcaceae bacterium]